MSDENFKFPICPCCHSSDRVDFSLKREYGLFWCPCNEPGPQYFNRDGSGTEVSTDSEGNLLVIPYFTGQP